MQTTEDAEAAEQTQHYHLCALGNLGVKKFAVEMIDLSCKVDQRNATGKDVI